MISNTNLSLPGAPWCLHNLWTNGHVGVVRSLLWDEDVSHPLRSLLIAFLPLTVFHFHLRTTSLSPAAKILSSTYGPVLLRKTSRN